MDPPVRLSLPLVKFATTTKQLGNNITKYKNIMLLITIIKLAIMLPSYQRNIL